MKQAYRDTLRSRVRRNPIEWDARARMGARRLLSAACFRETAESARRETGSALLPPIGFYYSLYHGTIAALCVDWRTDPNVLRRARHAMVARRVTDQLVKPKLVSASCSELLNQLCAFREYANYTVGGKLKSDYQYVNSIERAGTLYEETGQALTSILGFIKDVSSAAPTEPPIADRMAITIGDHIGEDVLQMYLSKEDGDQVVRYLVSQGFST